MTEERPPGPRNGLRILLYAQHLSGVGHYVRTYEIARSLATRHDVHMIEGGRPVPRAGNPRPFSSLALPGIFRGPGGLLPVEATREIGDVMQERARTLCTAIHGNRPDVLVVEHFPFSKWDLAEEITAAIRAARSANPAAQVICSLRDVVPQTRHEAVSDMEYRDRVCAQLDSHFDAVMVHGDPRLTRLEEHFRYANQLPVPVVYTGIVSEKAQTTPGAHEAIGRQTGGTPFILVSIGGGTGNTRFLECCIDAWKQLAAAAKTGGRSMVVFTGVDWPEDRLQALEQHASDGPVLVKPFTPDFLRWLQAADLAVTHAGYNTCANILETGTPALLVPDPRMSDQAFRASRLAERGIAATISAQALSVEALADAISHGLDRAPQGNDIDLDGAANTRRFIEQIAGYEPGEIQPEAASAGLPQAT